MTTSLVHLCFASERDSASRDATPRDGSRDLGTPARERGREQVRQHETSEEAALVARIVESDARAFEQLFDMLYPRLIRYAVALVDSDTAADVVVEVFVAVWETRATWRPERVDAFFYRAVRNRALNHLRSIRREQARRETYEDAAQAERGVHAEPTLLPDEDLRTAAVRSAVAELNRRQREFVVLRWHDGRTPAEIAELLGTTVRAITSLQDRTLAALRRRAPELLAQLQRESRG
jgi:RNA polymerase sigma-70 factor (ECF subfamily)